MRVIYLFMNLTSICGGFETFARKLNKHLALNGIWSEVKIGINVSFGDKAEQRTYIIFCVELDKLPIQTKQLPENTPSGSSVSRALVYRWHRQSSEDSSAPLCSKMTERHTVITESLTSNVLNSLQHGARQTVRGIALWNNIAVASEHKVLTEHMYRISGFSVIWSVFDYMVCI